MASWKDGLEGLRERNVTELACVMMSSQKPPYSAEVLEEARKSARKVEGGFASRSKHAKEYAAKVAAKKGDLVKKIVKVMPEGVQKEHYQEAIATAAMIDKAAAEAEAQAKTEVKPEVKVEVKPEVKVEVKPEVETEAKPMDVDPPSQKPSSQGTILRQPSDTAAAMAQVEKEPLIKTILRRVLERHEIKYHLSTLELDAKRKYSAKAASAVSHAMKKYNEHVEARNAKLPPAQRKPGLGEAALVEHVTSQAHKMLLAKLKEAAEPKKEEPPAAPKPGDASFVPAARPPGMEGKSFDDLVQYWKRLGELRVAYLPRVRQTLPMLQKYSRGVGQVAANAGNFAKMTEHTLIPLLSQTADEPMMTAKFTMDELAALEGHVKKLVALAGGRGVNEVPAPAPAAPKPAPTDEAIAGDTKRKRDGEEEEDGEGGDRKRAKTEDAPEPEPEPEPMPAPRAPSAFTGLTSCAPDHAHAQPAPPMPSALEGTSEKRPPGKSVGCPVAAEEGELVAAAVYSSDDVSYWAPDGELLRRALEGEVIAGATKSAAMFKAFEELKEVFSSA